MSDFQWSATIPDSVYYVCWRDIPEGVARLQYPDDATAQFIAAEAVRKGLSTAIALDHVTLRNPYEAHRPIDGNLPIEAGVLDRADLRKFLRECGVDLRVIEAEPAQEPLPPRKPLMQVNCERVLAALRAAGFDPLALPPLRSGKTCPAKAAARAGSKLTRGALDTAWKELRGSEQLLRQP